MKDSWWWVTLTKWNKRCIVFLDPANWSAKGILWAFCLYFFFLLFIGDRGLVHYLIVQYKVSKLEQTLDNLRKEKEIWEIRISESKENNDLLEINARENLGLSYPDEQIYYVLPE